MKRPRLYTIQSKFLFSITVSAIVIGSLFAVGFYFQMRSVLENEVRDKAELIFAQVESVQSYVRQTLRPRMFAELPHKFVIEAMSSSFITRSVMERSGEKTGQMVYRRVAENARNPDFEANVLERELIAHFRANPDAAIWKGHLTIDRLDHFVTARPVRFEKNCLYCHGSIEDAPGELLDKYGTRGFGRVENDVGGLDFVGLPVSAQMGKVKQRVLTYLVIFSATAVLFFLVTQVVFKRVVSDNVRTLMRLLHSSVKDDEGRQLLLDVQRRDEIDAMIQGVEQLSEHIAQNRNKLEEYAAGLEDKVAQRTRDLARESTERSADVHLFVRLLRVISKCQTRPQLWQETLPLIAQRFGLARAAYVCTFASNHAFVWPQEATKPELPQDYVHLLTHSQTRILEDRAFIPVESSEGNPEGLLCLEKRSGEGFRPEDYQILRALGRQLGIAAEYLGALDSILRHSENLQSIFEGISDPLMLVDRQGTPIVTNKAARELSAALEEGQGPGSLPVRLGEACGQDLGARLTAVHARRMPESLQIDLPSGRRFILGLYPLAATAGERLVVHISEITDQCRMLEQVARSEKMATVGKLAAGLAHEINNPLGVILCYAELLKKTAQPEQAQDLEVIIRHTLQARGVLRNLLDFARPKVAAQGAIDLAATARAVAQVFAPQAEEKGAVIDLRSHGAVPLVGVGPQIVEHTLVNLLLNALDALPPDNGRIEIDIRHDTDADEVVVEVLDNGAGIDRDDLPHLFDPFFTTKEIGKGAGLGLTMVYGIMRDLGGYVEAFNRPEGGARFQLRFPVRSPMKG